MQDGGYIGAPSLDELYKWIDSAFAVYTDMGINGMECSELKVNETYIKLKTFN